MAKTKTESESKQISVNLDQIFNPNPELVKTLRSKGYRTICV
jgi:hypothetical protein